MKEDEKPTTINIHEHRAPTDESLALLDEMEKEFNKRFVKTAASCLNDNLVSASTHLHIDPTHLVIKVKTVFKINEEISDVTVDIPLLDGQVKKDIYAVADQCIQRVVEKIALILAKRIVCGEPFREEFTAFMTNHCDTIMRYNR